MGKTKIANEYYDIMNKDKKVGTIVFKPDGLLIGFEPEFENCDKEIVDLYKDADTFLKSRCTVDGREYLWKLSGSCEFDQLKTYADVTMALSLNDTLWAKPSTSNSTWENVNFYANKFNEDIAKYALTGKGIESLNPRALSPEYSTNGMLPKCWARDDTGVYMAKGGTSGDCNTGNEPYSEYYACQVLKAMGLKGYVGYDLVEVYQMKD